MTIDEILKTLDLEHSEDIAKLLQDNGIVGWCFCDEHCPLANYIRNKGPFEFVSVCEDKISIDETVIATPEVLADFIDEFDSGEYPNLLSKK